MFCIQGRMQQDTYIVYLLSIIWQIWCSRTYCFCGFILHAVYSMLLGSVSGSWWNFKYINFYIKKQNKVKYLEVLDHIDMRFV